MSDWQGNAKPQKQPQRLNYRQAGREPDWRPPRGRSNLASAIEAIDVRARVLACVAAVFLFVGILIGFWPHSIDAGFVSADCGSVLIHGEQSLNLSNFYSGLDSGLRAGGCKAALDSAEPWMFGMFGLGAVAAIATVVVWKRN